MLKRCQRKLVSELECVMPAEARAGLKIFSLTGNVIEPSQLISCPRAVPIPLTPHGSGRRTRAAVSPGSPFLRL
jgi:hypothetical protein